MTVDTPVPPTVTGVPADPASEPAAPTMIPKARLDEEIGKRRALETDLAAVVETVLSDVPEHLRGLIPDLPPAQKLAWFKTARATGVFGTPSTVVPTTDTAPPRTTPAAADLSSLPAFARMSRGYGTK